MVTVANTIAIEMVLIMLETVVVKVVVGGDPMEYLQNRIKFCHNPG